MRGDRRGVIDDNVPACHATRVSPSDGRPMLAAILRRSIAAGELLRFDGHRQ